MKINFENLTQLEFKTNEAYKALRTNISFIGDDVKAISITSSQPNEGKSEVAFRLACSMAEDGKRVLFVDADIRKSVTVTRYGVDKETEGLSHYLAGKSKLEDVIYTTNVDNLDIIFTGKVAPNPAELLGNKRFEDLLTTAKEIYDYIIIDCPPLGQVIDAAIVSKKCDGALIVVEAGNVSYKAAQNVKKQLESSGVRILGAVLNKIEAAGKGYGKGYYGKGYYGKGYYGYGYGYGYGEHK